MNLAQALRLTGSAAGRSVRLALVGAGGKTSALFRLARDLATTSPGSDPLGSPVLVTTTTHLARSQRSLADRHLTIHRAADLALLEAGLPPGVTRLSGALTADERLPGLDPASLERLLGLSDAFQVPLLVEADGARQLPLKAPAAHEPAIPAWTEQVVVLAGLSALGKPLTSAWVHRPERFAATSGIQPGGLISEAGLARELIHPDGGFKNVPPLSRRVALLNQAATPQLQAQGLALARRLLPAYAAVIVANFTPTRDLPGNPEAQAFLPEAAVYAVHEPCAGVLLAAGGSTRLGQPKQLLTWRGKPLVYTVAATALGAGLSPLVVVTGAQAEGVAAAVRELPVQVIYNPDWAAGQSTSLQVGLRALPSVVGAAVFLLSDQPQIPAALERSLIERHAATLSPLVAPLAGGRRANPVLFDRCTFPDLLTLRGDTGGRAVFSRYPVEWVAWHDESILLDVDSPEDYQRLLEMA